jgi:hypothetical protein
MRRAGCACCAAAVTASESPTRLFASAHLPTISKPTRTEWPSADTSPRLRARSGERTFCTVRRLDTRATTSRIADWNAGSRTVRVPL